MRIVDVVETTLGMPGCKRRKLSPITLSRVGLDHQCRTYIPGTNAHLKTKSLKQAAIHPRACQSCTLLKRAEATIICRLRCLCQTRSFLKTDCSIISKLAAVADAARTASKKPPPTDR